MNFKYKDAVDEESAYEIIQAKYEKILAQQHQEEEEKIRQLEEKEAEKLRKAREKEIEKEKKERERARKANPLYKVGRTAVNPLTGDVGRKIARGLLGNVGNFFK